MKIEKFLQASPTFSIVLSAQEISKALNAKLRPEKLNFLQSLILVSIFFEESKTARPSELVKVFRTSKGNISHAISHLEEQKLIKRSVTKSDHRGLEVRLSAIGEKKVLSLIEYFELLQRNIESDLSQTDLDEFNSNTRRILNCHSTVPKKSL